MELGNGDNVCNVDDVEDDARCDNDEDEEVAVDEEGMDGDIADEEAGATQPTNSTSVSTASSRTHCTSAVLPAMV